MQVGIVAPQFRNTPDAAVAVARRADQVGLDGVFVFDHLWPLGHPERPALHSTTLLGALTSVVEKAALGTLVARVGLVPNAVLVHTFLTLQRMAPGGVIAGLGTGDRANRAENVAYGIPFPSVAERVAEVIACSRALRAEGVTTWIGGRSPAIHRAASEADAWNGWGLDAATFAEEAAAVQATAALEGCEVDVTWAGQVLIARDPSDLVDKLATLGDQSGTVVGTVEDVAEHFRVLARGGATWAVCSVSGAAKDLEVVDELAQAAAAVRQP